VTHLAQAGRFVGRRSEFELLQKRYALAASGTGNIIMLAGEVGAGKSRVVAEFCNYLSGLHTSYAFANCFEYAQSPFAPLLAILTTLTAANPEVLRRSPDIRSALASLIPELGEKDDRRDEPAPDKLRELNALTDALHGFATEHPLVLIVEDIHWADSASLELLQHFASRIESSRILIVATFRPEDLKHQRVLRSLAAKLERRPEVLRVELGPLSDEEMLDLVLSVADERLPLPAVTVRAICAQAEGNPLYAEELLKTVTQGGAFEPGSRLPSSLREAVLDRFRTLEETERQILMRAAVIGRRFSAEFLAQIADVTMDEVVKALKRAIEVSLVVEESNGEIYFTFTHEITRQTIYGELLTTETRRLHNKIATVLEALGPEEHKVELAYHWWQAHEPQKAAHYNELAAAAALDVFAYRDAVVNLERVLATGYERGARLASLNLTLANALHQCGLTERAKRVMESALEYFVSAGDRQNAAAAYLRLAWMYGGYDDTLKAIDLTKQALDMIGNNPDDPAYLSAHTQMMRLYAEYRWEPEKLREHTALAERARGVPTLDHAYFLLLRAVGRAGLGNPAEALADVREASTLAEKFNDPRAAIICWGHLAVVMVQAGEASHALECFDRALAIVRERRLEGLTSAWVLADYAYAKLKQGNLGEARESVLQGLTANIEMPGFRIVLARAGIPAGLQLEEEHLVKRCAQKELVDFALQSSVTTFIGATVAFAERHFAQGRSADAAALVHSALDALERSDARPTFGDADDLFIAVARFGNREDIDRARKFLERVAQTSKVRSTPAYLVLFDAYRAKRSDDEVAATEKALTAARLFGDIGWPHLEAEALEIADKTSEAAAIYKRIGAVRDLRRLEPVLNPVNRRGRAKAEITAREREICDLLVKGMANKMIADKLAISERTVESHVSSILSKLAVGTRAELIAKLKS
jgi:DNA-binding CsgD family transcriptional regulator/tetratricopeptide (TPR) repeat protein